MAYIYIKRRKEAIVISNERALKLKKLWLENPKSADLVDLEQWSGALNEIVSIEMEKNNQDNKIEDFNTEYHKHRKMKLAQPPERRAKNLEEFKLIWFTRSGLTEKEAPQEALEKAEKISFDYFTKNNLEFRVPAIEFEPILFARFGVKSGTRAIEKVAVKMKVEKTEEASDIPF